MASAFDQIVSTRYHIYNSLFLNLPFSKIYRTGTLLPFVQQYAEEGFEKRKDPQEIMENFFADFAPKASPEERFDLLFSFIQYAERQVVLFDSIEDAAFDKVNDLHGKGTVSALLVRAASDEKKEKLRKKLEEFSVRVVLTAHPTQFYPGNVLAIINDLEEAIREDDLAGINQLLQQLGKTPIINREKPTPFEEAVSLCWYLENVFYHAAPQIVSRLLRELQVPVTAWKNFNLFRIGFWPGGDRDGNPFVTHDITLKVAARLRETILKCYHRDLRMLRRRLTFRGVDNLIVEAERKVYEAIYVDGKGYQQADELLTDLFRIRETIEADHEGLFLNQLDAFIVKVSMFGFFFASMDIRQDSRKNQLAWDELLRINKVKHVDSLSEEQKIKLILKTKIDLRKANVKDPFVRELIDSVFSIEKIQNQNGTQGCHRYVISNCGSARDVINVFQLARLAIGTKQGLALDIVPLFETIDDLKHAGEVMETLYAIPEYQKHLQKRGSRQTIMLGFSDGTKDGGYLRANWSIFRAKENLTRISRKHGITVLFFDGRGGPPARGGGNTHDFYASLGSSIEDHEVQLTVQGQTISSNFGKVTSCRFNLEQLLSAGIEQDVFGEESGDLTAEDKALLDSFADAGYRSYLGLKLHEKFVPYLEKITPLSFFGETNIGSRPVKRNASDGLKFEDLRAIPFVGAWAQMKQNIPGFYGVGSALEEMKSQGQFTKLKNLYRRSLFFRTLLANSMMSLTKTYYPATRYLSNDEEFGAFWNLMFDEFERSRKRVLEVASLDELMENNPVNRASVKLRERIVMPLIVMQQFALQRLRSGADKKYTAHYQKLVLRCMFGIINAARNSA
ncbi:MAG: phosphoenolpyruvate carboxylase [Cyclobacteriaceae bacterium]|nr:phosphoenolpyruvate carboxylase [Cyclobacteriaceae bacterium]UYN87208.1 MAG: phosphoenolpyruvate carboxylase [Cyclobacteriaceae bacterium]